jgi:hypothetical protein
MVSAGCPYSPSCRELLFSETSLRIESPYGRRMHSQRFLGRANPLRRVRADRSERRSAARCNARWCTSRIVRHLLGSGQRTPGEDVRPRIEGPARSGLRYSQVLITLREDARRAHRYEVFSAAYLPVYGSRELSIAPVLHGYGVGAKGSLLGIPRNTYPPSYR